MSLQQLKEDQHRKVLKGQNVNCTDIDINIRNQKIETADSFTYLGCIITNDQRQDTELSARLTKASKAFNMLRHAIWHRKSVSITARLRIFRACILPVLLYGSETWALTMKQKQRIASFYNRCLRTIIGVNQDGCPSLTKKTMFGYFHGEKRPSNMGRRKRWEDSVLKDIEELNIGNWRKMTLDRSRWCETINRNVHVNSVNKNVKSIVHDYKQCAAQRRKVERATPTGVIKRKVTEILVKENNQYKCPGCRKNFKSQGITNPIKSCDKAKT